MVALIANQRLAPRDTHGMSGETAILFHVCRTRSLYPILPLEQKRMTSASNYKAEGVIIFGLSKGAWVSIELLTLQKKF